MNTKLDICSVSTVGFKTRRIEEQEHTPCPIADKLECFVRHCSPDVSTGQTVPELRSKDRRIQKTLTLLREALVSLLHEKDYDSLAIKEILYRANVGRSTFYTHFRNKDELLASLIYERLHSIQPKRLPASAKPHERIISFSLTFFENHGQRRHGGEANMGRRARAILHEHLHKAVAELVAAEVRIAFQGRRKPAVPSGLLVQHIASTFILVLNWWGESRHPLPPKDINDLFRALILPALARALEA